MMKQIYKKCPVCDGRGYNYVYDWKYYGTGGPDSGTMPCPKCDGAGYIKTDLFFDDNGVDPPITYGYVGLQNDQTSQINLVF